MLGDCLTLWGNVLSDVLDIDLPIGLTFGQFFLGAIVLGLTISILYGVFNFLTR